MTIKRIEEDEVWDNLYDNEPKKYFCGYCDSSVSSSKGLKLTNRSNGNHIGGIYICPLCKGPTFLYERSQIPGKPFGRNVHHLPEDLEQIYNESRECSKNNCHTAAVMLCRKILMYVAVEEGAEEGKTFYDYVEYLSNENFIPPKGKHWVDHIRKKGNEANHEIIIMGEQDAQDLITFTENLLRFNYELPNAIPQPDTESEQGNN